MTAERVTVFCSISDSVLDCIRDRVQNAHKWVVHATDDIRGKLSSGVTRVDIAGHSTADGLLRFGDEVIGDPGTDQNPAPFIAVLEAMKAHGVTEVNFLGCETGRGGAGDKLAALKARVGIEIRGTNRELGAGDYGHTGLRVHVEGEVFGTGGIPNRTDPSFRLMEWMRGHLMAPIGRTVEVSVIDELETHLSPDYLTVCVPPLQASSFNVPIGGHHACFRVTNDGRGVVALSGRTGDPPVDVFYQVTEGHEDEVKRLMASVA